MNVKEQIIVIFIVVMEAAFKMKNHAKNLEKIKVEKRERIDCRGMVCIFILFTFIIPFNLIKYSKYYSTL